MNNEWIKWDGGECPVDGETLVDVVIYDEYYNDRFEDFGKTANTFDWSYWHEQEIYIEKYRLSAEENKQ